MAELVYLIAVLVVIVLLIGMFVIIYILSKKQRIEKELENNNHTQKVQQFIEKEGIQDDAFWTNDNILEERTVLSINNADSNAVFAIIPSIVDLKSERKTFEIERIAFEDIIEVKMTFNSKTVKSTLQDTKNSTPVEDEAIQEMSLEIITNNQQKPKVKVIFYHTIFMGLQKDMPKYEKVDKQLNNAYQKFEDILSRTQQ